MKIEKHPLDVILFLSVFIFFTIKNSSIILL